MTKVTVYTRDKSLGNCNWCDKATSMLEYYGVPYKNISIGKDITKDEFKSKFNIKTVPAIFFDEEHIGGYGELATRVWELPVGDPATHG